MARKGGVRTAILTIGIAAGVAVWLVLMYAMRAGGPGPGKGPPTAGDITPDPRNGAYLAWVAGCVGCHTAKGKNARLLAGGRSLKTPFGTFVTPNITPDSDTGIGGWSFLDFFRALTEGVSPDGGHYYPAFPYPSYTRLATQDIADIKAYLDRVAAVKSRPPGHDLRFPYAFRPGLLLWKAMYFRAGAHEADPRRDGVWNRGAYLVEAVAHCGECHTPRTALGGPDDSRRLRGVAKGVHGEKVPGLFGGLKGWTRQDLELALRTGLKPNGDSVGGSMGDVVGFATRYLTPADGKAVAEYLFSPGAP